MIENSEYRAFINAGSEQYSEKYPIDVAVNLFKEIQAIYNGTYLVAVGERVRMTKADSNNFRILTSAIKSGSIQSEIILTLGAIQTVLPIVSAVSAKDIYELAGASIQFVLDFLSKKDAGENPTISVTADGNNATIVTGSGVTINYNGPVYNIANKIYPSLERLATTVDESDLDDINITGESSDAINTKISKGDSAKFKPKKHILRITEEVQANLFDLNKFKREGKILVTLEGQALPTGEYPFEIAGEQESIEYIEAMKDDVTKVFYHRVMSDDPWRGTSIAKLHVIDVE